MSPLLVGVDLGTSAVKVLVVDETGARRSSASMPVPGSTSSVAEQEARAVETAARQAVREALSEVERQEVKALAFSAAMHGFMAVEARGEPLSPLFTWAHGQSREEAERLARSEEGEKLLSRTGCPVTALYYPARLRWFAFHHPDLFRRAFKFLSLKDWLLWRLTGRWTMDRSHASSNGLLNLRSRTWDEGALAAAGISPARLPELVDSDVAAGEVLSGPAQEWGLPPGIAVIPGAGDGGLANVGAGAVDAGQAAVTIGTSGALRKILPVPWTDSQGRLWCYYLAEERWYAGGAINNGGVILRWLRDGMLSDVAETARAAGQEPYAAIIALADTVGPGAEGLIFLPYLYGERTPYWNPAARGVLFGLRPHHGKAHLARAALEGICLGLAHVYELLRPSPGGITEVRAGGGFARSPTWVQLLADVLGQAVVVPLETEGSAFGAALLAMKAAGVISSLSEARNLTPVQKVFEPDIEKSAFYRERLEFFKKLYEHLERDCESWEEMDHNFGRTLSSIEEGEAEERREEKE